MKRYSEIYLAYSIHQKLFLEKVWKNEKKGLRLQSLRFR